MQFCRRNGEKLFYLTFIRKRMNSLRVRIYGRGDQQELSLRLLILLVWTWHKDQKNLYLVTNGSFLKSILRRWSVRVFKFEGEMTFDKEWKSGHILLRHVWFKTKGISYNRICHECRLGSSATGLNYWEKYSSPYRNGIWVCRRLLSGKMHRRD